MKVQIEDNLWIESDSYQFIIKEYTGKTSTDKDGKVTELYNTYGYYPSLQSAIKKIVLMKVKESTASTLAELLEDVRRIEAYIEQKVTV